MMAHILNVQELDLVTPPINCWNKQGHGSLDIREAIEQSCNVFFTTIGFELGKDSEGNFSEARSLGMLQKYASLMGLDQKTGIEISEASPQVSDKNAVPSYIGQGTNAFTTSQLARYASTIATSGTIYKLSLLDRVTDSKGKLIKEYPPKQLDSWIFPAISGMTSMTVCIVWCRLMISLTDLELK